MKYVVASAVALLMTGNVSAWASANEQEAIFGVNDAAELSAGMEYTSKSGDQRALIGIELNGLSEDAEPGRKIRLFWVTGSIAFKTDGDGAAVPYIDLRFSPYTIVDSDSTNTTEIRQYGSIAVTRDVVLGNEFTATISAYRKVDELSSADGNANRFFLSIATEFAGIGLRHFISDENGDYTGFLVNLMSANIGFGYQLRLNSDLSFKHTILNTKADIGIDGQGTMNVASDTWSELALNLHTSSILGALYVRGGIRTEVHGMTSEVEQRFPEEERGDHGTDYKYISFGVKGTFDFAGGRK